MLKHRFAAVLSSLLVLVAGLVFSPPAWADSQVRIVRLSLVDGPVQIDRGTEQGFEKAIMNMPITQGMRIATDSSARAEVEFEDGTTLRLAPGSEVAFPQLGLRSSGARITTVQVDQGTAYFNVRRRGDNDFRVAFAGREIPITHNVHFRLDLAGGNPELAVFNGELEVFGGLPERVKIKKNQTFTFDAGDPARYDVAGSVASLTYDVWDNERLNYASQYASNSYYRSPYAYGVSDLNYYGTWVSWPGYGMLWRPFGVGFGWDPFYNGAWAWYPGFGYTWVSTYPWGWTPYRYGSWVFVANRGWGWRPGGWRTWYTVPPVYNPPPYYHGPRPPVVTTYVGAGPYRHHPTVVVDAGVGVIRGPRTVAPAEGFVAGSPRGTVGRIAPGAIGRVPGRSISPAPGTGIVAPVSPARIRGGHSDMRTHTPDHDRPMRVGSSPAAGGPRAAPSAPRMEHSGPRAAPSAPRMEHSGPMRSAPAGGGSANRGGGRNPR